MGIALLALVGVFVSGYLALYNFGLLGTIQCAVGGCLAVKSSPYAWFPPRTVALIGVPVSVLGAAAYAGLLLLALAGLQPRWVTRRWVAIATFTLAAGGLAFSAGLTYLEAAVIRAWCQWCVVSAVLITLIFLLSIVQLRRPQRTTPA